MNNEHFTPHKATTIVYLIFQVILSQILIYFLAAKKLLNVWLVNRGSLSAQKTLEAS